MCPRQKSDFLLCSKPASMLWTPKSWDWSLNNLIPAEIKREHPAKKHTHKKTKKACQKVVIWYFNAEAAQSWYVLCQTTPTLVQYNCWFQMPGTNTHLSAWQIQWSCHNACRPSAVCEAWPPQLLDTPENCPPAGTDCWPSNPRAEVTGSGACAALPLSGSPPPEGQRYQEWQHCPDAVTPSDDYDCDKTKCQQSLTSSLKAKVAPSWIRCNQ